MTSLAHDPTTTAPRPAGNRTVTLLAALAALSLAPYLAGVLVPYYVNDLDALPLAEVASGRHDPKDLWPHGTVGGLAQLAGFSSLVLTPLGLLATLAGCVHGLLPRAARRTPVVTAGLVLVTLVCLAGLGLVLSPLGGALATWRLG